VYSAVLDQVHKVKGEGIPGRFELLVDERRVSRLAPSRHVRERAGTSVVTGAAFEQTGSTVDR
jgi:hypothetical protein